MIRRQRQMCIRDRFIHQWRISRTLTSLERVYRHTARCTLCILVGLRKLKLLMTFIVHDRPPTHPPTHPEPRPPPPPHPSQSLSLPLSDASVFVSQCVCVLFPIQLLVIDFVFGFLICYHNYFLITT